MCASQLTTPEAALIAGMVASPSGYDPLVHPLQARHRRDQVLRNMRDQGYITPSEYEHDLQDPLPTQNDLTPPQEKSVEPYFTSWLRQQVVDHFGPFRAFSGGLQITTSLDLDLQSAAENAITQMLPTGSGLPTGSLVAIDNHTGEVRAMVGGSDYGARPFNLATQGERQPGSTFKPFVLTAALESGISPGSVWTSRPKQFVVPNSRGKEFFPVKNYGNEYTGSNTLAGATTVSDNSIFAEVGIKVGTHRIARVARRMGIRTPISTNYAMILGGLHTGVTPLDLAHAYSTFATGGKRLYNPQLGAPNKGPIGIDVVRNSGGKVVDDNRHTLETEQEIPPGVASNVTSILQTVIAYGTGKQAQIPGFAAGKTGTTSNYGDAWFVGWNHDFTVAVWVGYPDKLVPMLTQFSGGPVAGGTYPALIWHNFMVAATGLLDQRKAAAEARRTGKDAPTTTSDEGQLATPPGSGGGDGTTPAATTPAPGAGGGGAQTGGTPGGAGGGAQGGGTGGGTGGQGGTGATGGQGGGTGGPTGTPGGTATPTPPAGGGGGSGGGAAAPTG
jgi:penicillin-binding protein 1A